MPHLRQPTQNLTMLAQGSLSTSLTTISQTLALSILLFGATIQRQYTDCKCAAMDPTAPSNIVTPTKSS